MMTDTRNQYRAISRMDTFGVVFTVQRKRWWLPFWSTVTAHASDEDRARQYAMNDAAKATYKPRTVNFGRFPNGRNH